MNKITGLEEIQEERNEQIHKHNRSVKNDVIYNGNGEIPQAIKSLVIPDRVREGMDMDGESFKPYSWRSDIWIKMWNKPYNERVRIAGALCAAEIDRLKAVEKEILNNLDTE